MQPFLETLFTPYRERRDTLALRVEVRCLKVGGRPTDGEHSTTNDQYLMPNAPRLWTPVGRIGLLAAARRAECWAEDWEVYYGVLPRSGNMGTAQSVTCAAWLWCDIDHAPEWETVWEMLTAANVPLPHLAVCSGNGHHCYWRLREVAALSDAPARVHFRSLLRRLCQQIGGEEGGAHADRASADVARILRLPGTFNHKQPDQPKYVRLVWDDPHAERWTLSAWMAALPAETLPAPSGTMERWQEVRRLSRSAFEVRRR